MTNHNADELAGPMQALLAYRHGDKKHLTQEHARLLYESFSRHPQQPQGGVVSAPTDEQIEAACRAIFGVVLPNLRRRVRDGIVAALAALPSPVARRIDFKPLAAAMRASSHAEAMRRSREQDFPAIPSPVAEDEQPRVIDNDAGEISVTLSGNELRGWSYKDDSERRTKMLAAREYVEGWCDGRAR